PDGSRVVERPEEGGAGERAPTGRAEPERDREPHEDRGRQREAQASAPPRVELAVAEADRDRIQRDDEGADAEERRRRPVASWSRRRSARLRETTCRAGHALRSAASRATSTARSR